jgi:hypothetical protein
VAADHLQVFVPVEFAAEQYPNHLDACLVTLITLELGKIEIEHKKKGAAIELRLCI